MGFFASDQDQSGTFSGPIDPSLFGAPDLSRSAPLGIPSVNSARGSPAAALLARAFLPYSQAYEDFGVKPVRAAWNFAKPLIEPLTDPGLLMSLSGVFPPAGIPAAAEIGVIKGLRALAEIRTPGLPLSDRAQEILEALNDPIASNHRTVAVLRTDGPTIVASGTKDIYPKQRANFQPGEVEARLPGAHAEITALQDAQNRGATPKVLGVSRTICPTCRQAIESAGGWVDSAGTARFPGPDWLQWIPPY